MLNAAKYGSRKTPSKHKAEEHREVRVITKVEPKTKEKSKQ